MKERALKVVVVLVGLLFVAEVNQSWVVREA